MGRPAAPLPAGGRRRGPGARALGGELAALALLAALAWLLGAVATDAWLARVARLDGVEAPPAAEVRALARSAALQLSLAALALGGARVVAHRRARDPIAVPWLLPCALAACVLGLVLHLATVEVVRGRAVAPSGAAFAQGVLLGAVLAAGVLVAPGDLLERLVRARRWLAAAIGVVFLALAVAGHGPAGSGTRINLGPVQPIELVKLLAVLFLAGFLGARAAKLRWQRRRLLGLRWPRLELLVPAVLVLVAIVAGLYVIGDLGPVLVLALVFVGMSYLASRATGWAALAVAVLLGLLALLGRWPALAGGGTVSTRLRMWQDPWDNGLRHGQQLGEGLWAIAAGGARGQGLAEAATPLLPAGKTDLMLATLTEQLGAAGLVGYQLLLLGVVLAALVVAARARTAERCLIAGGAAALVLAQWAVIHAGTLGQLPLTGIVVPFLSAGRSSMVMFVVLLALVARVAADGHPRAPAAELVELQAGARGLAVVAALVCALAVGTGVRAAVVGRHDTRARGILSELADGTRVRRHDPRLVALAAKIRRGDILDRAGAPLATSPAPGARRYPLGAALGTLLGAHPARVLLPPWALERVLDDRLRGGADLRALAPLLDLAPAARARAVAALDAAVPARSVRLTLDGALQARVAALLRTTAARHEAAAAVVIDVDTGHVLARAQVPDLDPGDPAWQARVLAGAGGDAAAAAALARLRGAYGAWPDKTGVHGMFQVGSVAKLFTALAAVRAGAADAVFPCTERDAQGPLFTRPGWPRAIHDHAADPTHGRLGLVEAIAVSCNVYFGQLGLALGGEPLRALRAAGVEIGYGAALAPGADGSRQLASSAFGQGAMVMSPVQAARLVAALAGGGVYRRCAPSMELEAPCTATALVDDPAALAPILAGMRRVMTAGTGARLRPPAGLRVYGKTGTADVGGFRGEEPYGITPGAAAPPHAWFVAFAEPTAVPEGAAVAPGRLAIAVVVPRGGTGGGTAGPIAMQLLAAAQELGYLRAAAP